MRLPGIQQGPVQGLGRDTTDAYARQRNVVAAANVAMQKTADDAAISGQQAQLFEKAAGMHTDIIDKRAAANDAMIAASQKAETMKALATYKAQVSAGMANTSDFDEQGEPIWENQEDKLHSIKRDAQATAREGIVSENSSMMFEEGKFEVDAAADGAWSNQVNTARLNDIKSISIGTMDEAITNHDWDNLEIVLNDPHLKQALTPLVMQQYQAALKRGRMLDGYEVQRKNTVQSVEGNLALKAKVLEDPSMSKADKASFLAAINTGQIDFESGEFTKGVAAIENEFGLEKAVMTATAEIDSLVRMPAEELGGDEAYKARLIDTMQAIRNDFASALKKTGTSYNRQLKYEAMLTGRDTVSPRHNAKEWDNLFFEMAGGQFDGKKRIPGSLDERTLFDPESPARQVLIDMTREKGFMPMTAERVLGTALMGDDEQSQAAVIELFGELNALNPAVAFRNPEASFMKELYSLSQLLGQSQAGKDETLKLYRAHAAMGKAEIDMYKDQRYSHDYKEFIEKSFSRVLEDKFPATARFFGTAKPDIQKGLQMRITTLAGEYLPMAQGDANTALNMAFESIKHEYGVSNVNGKGSQELVHYPAGKVMSDLNGMTPAKNDSWIREQVGSDVLNWQIQGGGDPDYDVSHIELIPAFDFDVTNPKYTLLDKNPSLGGFYTTLGTYTPDFNSTPTAREQRRVKEIGTVRSDNIAKQQQLSDVWEKENANAYMMQVPQLKSALDPHDGFVARGLRSVKHKTEQVRHSLFGPLGQGYPSEDTL